MAAHRQISESVEAVLRVVCREKPALLCLPLFLAYIAAYAIHNLLH